MTKEQQSNENAGILKWGNLNRWFKNHLIAKYLSYACAFWKHKGKQWWKQVFTSSLNIFFRLGSAVEGEMNVNRLKACWTNIWWVVTNLQMLCRKNSFSLICRVLTSICVQNYAQGVTIKLVSKSLYKRTPHEFQKIHRKAFKPYLLNLGRCTELWGLK